MNRPPTLFSPGILPWLGGLMAVACLCLWGCAARAEEPQGDLTALKKLSIEQIMQIDIPTVSGASKHVQKITEAPSSVSIVTREEIQAYGHRTLADVLRSVRDFYVGYDRNYGYIGVRGFNRPGDLGGRVLILVDGHRLNEPIFDSAGVVTDFPIDVDMIERVEVIRGPGSALYGNNAFFAVINVVTRTAADAGGVEASAEAGSYDTYKGRISYGHVFQSGLSVLLNVSEYDSAGGDLYFPSFAQKQNHGGIAHDADGDHFDSGQLTVSYEDFTLQSGYISRHKDVPTAAFNTIFDDPRFFTVDQRSFTRLCYDHEFANDLSVHADVYWNSYYYDGDYPVAVDTDQPRHATINHDWVDANWWGGELRVSKELFQNHRVTAGAEFQDDSMLRQENYNVQPRFNYARLRTSDMTVGLYLQDEWAITPRLTLTTGLRYDHFDSFGDTENPRIGLIYHPAEATTIKLLYGQAFRAPSVYESAFMADTNRSNPNLLPERTKGFELALEQELTSTLRLSVSGFYSHITNLISQETDADTGKLFFDNVNQADTQGGSIEFEARLPHGIKGRLSYTLQQTTDGATGDRLSNSPEHLAKLGLIVPLWGDRLTSGLELQASSAVENTHHERIGGFLLANWTLLSQRLTPHLDASASIYNLFNTKYAFPGGPEHAQDSLQQDGRTFRVKLTYHF